MRQTFQGFTFSCLRNLLHWLNHLLLQEARNITDYVNNLEDIKKRLLDTGATVGFVLSTPVTYDKRKDDMIRKYNHAAKR